MFSNRKSVLQRLKPMKLPRLVHALAVSARSVNCVPSIDFCADLLRIQPFKIRVCCLSFVVFSSFCIHVFIVGFTLVFAAENRIAKLRFVDELSAWC